MHFGVVLPRFVPVLESQDMVLEQSPAPTPETRFLNPDSVPSLSNADSEMCVGSQNQAFKEGAVRGYQVIAQSSPMASVEIEDNINAAKTIIEIDSGSDLDSSDEDRPVPMEVEDWVRNPKASGASLQHFDLGTNRWKNLGEELSDGFCAELRAMASIYRQDDSGNIPSDGPETDTAAMTQSDLAVRSRDSPKEFENLHELCADVLHMHGDQASNSELAANEEIEYQFCWTGM